MRKHFPDESCAPGAGKKLVKARRDLTARSAVARRSEDFFLPERGSHFAVGMYANRNLIVVFELCAGRCA